MATFPAGYIAICGGTCAVHVAIIRQHSANPERFIKALPFADRLDDSVEPGSANAAAIFAEAARAGVGVEQMLATLKELARLTHALTGDALVSPPPLFRVARAAT